MARPVTLFTGQWADLSLETLAKKARDLLEGEVGPLAGEEGDGVCDAVVAHGCSR